MSLTETGIRFGVGAFVQPSDSAQLTGNRVELRVFPREPVTISVSESWALGGADQKGPVRMSDASLHFHTWRCSARTFSLGTVWKGSY